MICVLFPPVRLNSSPSLFVTHLETKVFSNLIQCYLEDQILIEGL